MGLTSCKEKHKREVCHSPQICFKQQINQCLGLTGEESLKEHMEKYHSSPCHRELWCLSAVALASLAVWIIAAFSHGIQQNNL